MIEDKISIQIIDSNQELKTLTWSLKGLIFVEQLVYDILTELGVGPVYRCLFGLKIIGENIWLAPNVATRDLLKWARIAPSGTRGKSASQTARLELRFRFRPASYRRLLVLDPAAFDRVFCQVRRDFLRTKFNDDKRDFLLLNDAVMGLVAADLIRYSLEHNINISDVLKRTKSEDFIPKRASKWQRALLFRLAEKINLKKSLQIGFEECNQDLGRIKQRFIEVFLLEVAKDYGTEYYNVVHINNDRRTQELDVRVRYYQTHDDSNCSIETRSKIHPSSGPDQTGDNRVGGGEMVSKQSAASSGWQEICNMDTISHATLRQRTVQIVRLNNCPIRLEFKTLWHAESFLSLVDGYFRLMRKWNFNLCREIHSPDLVNLKQLCCHGPIGYATTRSKLSSRKRPESFLIRRCMEKNHRYYIDTILKSRARLTIDLDWSPERKVYQVSGHSVCNGSRMIVRIESGLESYAKLQDLVGDIQLKLEDETNGSYSQQLKYWLQPDEFDDYPALLVSMGKRRELDFEANAGTRGCTERNSASPRVISSDLLETSMRLFPRASNKMLVKLAKLDGNKTVVVKSHMKNNDSQESGLAYNSPGALGATQLTLHLCPDEQCQIKSNLLPGEIRLPEWILVRHSTIAETIALDYINDGLVQEYFPLGGVDRFLAQNCELSGVARLSISLQLAQALMFLQEKRLIHGKIRCHNVLVRQAHPIQVKISDPLGTIDTSQDCAFLPPNYFNKSGQVCLKEFDSSIDIWALGTTMWQIYSSGARPPPNQHASLLKQPQACPNKVWRLIESCWHLETRFRASAQSLYRDLNDLFAWEKEAHDYLYISPDDSDSAPSLPSHIQMVACPNNSTTSDQVYLFHQSYASSCATSTLTENSQAALLTPLSSSQSFGHDNLLRGHQNSIRAVGGGEHSSGTSTKMANGGTTSCNGLVADQQQYRHFPTKKFCQSTWRSIMQFRGRPLSLGGRRSNGGVLLGEPDYLPSRIEFSEFSGSHLSLADSSANCSTPTGSEATKLTDLLDFQSISDAFDRCVWHVDSNRLKLGAEIGRGSSGVVVKGVMMSGADGGCAAQTVAVKCLDRDSSNLSLNRIGDLRREFDILKNLDHKNIVKTLGYVEESYMMLIFEYLPLGSLLTRIKSAHPRDLESLPLRKYALDIADGMEYLTNMKIVHRDLALRNILMKSHDEVKICDFGLAQFLGSSNHYKLKTERPLPLKWYAPESISTWTFTHKSDVWSYGVVLWEIYSGGSNPHYPGTYANLSEILKHERLPMPKGCPQEMYDLMLKCWAYNADERISFSSISTILNNDNHQNPTYSMNTQK